MLSYILPYVFVFLLGVTVGVVCCLVIIALEDLQYRRRWP